MIFYLKQYIEGMSNNSTVNWFKYAKEGNLDGIKDLLEGGIDINIQDINFYDTALTLASYRGHTEIVKLLVEKGAALDILANDGMTALIIAVAYGYTEIVKLLVEKGAALDILAKDGNTALILASTFGMTKIVKLLVEKGAALDIQSKFGNTALMIASSLGYTEIVKLLVEKGASLDILDKDGNTALMLASTYGKTEIVKLLLEKGADIFIENKDGKTALDLAKDPEIKKMLLKAQEKRNEKSGQELAVGYEKMTGQSAKPGTGPANLIKKFAGLTSTRGYAINKKEPFHEKIKGHVQDSIYQYQKKLFNKKFMGQQGGRSIRRSTRNRKQRQRKTKKNCIKLF